MTEPNYAAADSTLEVSTKVCGDALLVHCEGGFSMINHLLLARTVQEIKAAPQRKIVLDMSDVIFIDSMGVGVIVSVLKYTRTNAIGFSLVTNDVVDQILSVTRLNAILQVVHTVDDAIAKATP